MLRYIFFQIVLFLTSSPIFAQTQTEIVPPFHIKTVSFIQNGENVIPIFKLGEGFQFQFDDLHGDEANYYFEIVHCDYNWIPTDILKVDYMKGVDGQRIQQYENSINTLQIYSHYILPVPNQFMQLRLSGNYMLKILDENREVILSRKFMFYEDLATIPMQIKRARTTNLINFKHNIDFTVRSQKLIFQTPLQNIKVHIFQNGQLNNPIKNVVPQYTIGNDLVYKYDTETQFWAGNEFLSFDNSNVRAPGNAIGRIDSKGDIYNSYLFTNAPRKFVQYTFFPDVNGNFVVRNIGAARNEIEADYAWVYFSIAANNLSENSNIYVNGLFNNFSRSPDYKMDFNATDNTFEKALLLKQGFVNYQYQVTDDQGKIIGEDAVDGNFWQTENDYTILVYYRENTDRYQRLIGKNTANSSVITN